MFTKHRQVQKRFKTTCEIESKDKSFRGMIPSDAVDRRKLRSFNLIFHVVLGHFMI